MAQFAFRYTILAQTLDSLCDRVTAAKLEFHNLKDAELIFHTLILNRADSYEVTLWDNLKEECLEHHSAE